MHPVGLPILIAPFFALGGIPRRRVLMVLMAAVTSGLTWVWVRKVTGSVSAATFAWAAAALTVSFGQRGTVYPEVAAALAVSRPGVPRLGFSDATGADTPRRREPWRALLLGLATAALPWLQPSTRLCPPCSWRSARGVSRRPPASP